MELTGIRKTVFLDRYALKNESGTPTEQTPEEMWRRVAHAIAQIEKKPDRTHWEEQFYDAMKDFVLIPGGRILSGAGTGYKVTFYNCFVIPSPHDSRQGILSTLSQMVEIMSRGGGVGINLSSLRPRGTRVKKVNGFSSGPCNWAELFSVATKDIIQQGGSRRGALMLMLWDWHPDVEEFITVKQDLARINGANLSVCVSDTFMEAVKADADWDLVFPDTSDPDYDTKWDGYMPNWIALGKTPIVKKTIKARALWDLVAQAAWRSAEPGVVFMERYNKWFNNSYFEYVNCVNPCVTADTLVSTTNGSRTIRDLYTDRKPFTVLVHGKAYLSSPVFKTGTKQVYRLRTKEGYQVRLTGDHKVYTPQGKIEANKLKKGDKIQLTTGGSFGTRGTVEEGQVLGWLVGDGSMKADVATLYFYQQEKEELAPKFAQMVMSMVDGQEMTARAYPIAPQYIEKENKAVVESVRLWRVAQTYGLSHENKYVVPMAVFTGSEAIQRGYLQGLFSSDGHVAGTAQKGVSVRLTSVSQSLLVDVQRLLLNFGIVSTIYENRRDKGERMMPDGHGGQKAYECQAYHDLVISKTDLHLFGSLIGFLQKEKQEKLRSLLATYIRGPYKKTFTATFTGLEKDGIEEVFDITVAEVHRFAANGLIVSNCGEEGLPNWGVCNLTSINVSALVNEKGEMDYERLAKIAKIGVRFQDDVIDADFYVFDQIKKVQLEGERRIGLGTMGLGDALIKMKLRYGSEESLAVIDKVYKIIRDAAYESSVEIAHEKGPFPKIDKEKHLNAYFIKKLPESIRKQMKKYGVRNSVILQQAPTGSTSLMAGVSSGIEPVYEFEFIRRDRLGEHVLRHPLYEAWVKEFTQKNGREPKKEERPAYFVSANDLTPEDHVRVQANIQQYVDASISKTVNAPRTHTIEDVKRLYTLAYDLGCKGIAYMREGSREGVLTRKESTDVKVVADKEAKVQPVVDEVKPRPMVVHGSTYQLETPMGQAYITINTNGGRQPLEMFINVGKAGSDVTAMAEALGRLISLTLRMSSPISPMERVHRIAAELIGIGGARSLGFGENRVRSLPDAIAKAIDRHFGFFTKHHLTDAPPGMPPSNGLSNGHTNGHAPVTINAVQQSLVPPSVNTEDGQESMTPQAFLDKPRMVTVDLCPSCGEGSLVFEESCKKCYSCGYSEC
jgi:ribonucleoside-diphosphate reductase alpha chain